ncbi:MAG: TRAP transporter substrate-binding protein [Deltaproteobacteria bacterium]|nr:TRAP transporter substrate-binding protein [Deltaproteobacteria bacterium]
MHRRAFITGSAALAASTALPAMAQDGTYTMKLATVAPEGTPWSDGLAQFKKAAEAATAGRLKVKVFFGGILGDENETVQQTQRGQIQGVGASTGAIASIVPELNILELPFLFKTAAEADYVLDGAALAPLEKNFRDRGLQLGFWSENGYRSFGTTFGFIKSPADLKGHKMRSQENPVHLAMYQAFGASPVPIPTTEVLTSLQTGVIDGYDNTPLYASAAQWTSNTKFFTLTNHIYQPAAIVLNKAWYDALPEDIKKVILATRADLAVRMRKEIRALHPILVANFASMKVQTYTPTAAELTTFEGPAKTARDTYMGKASAGEKALYKTVTDALGKYRSGAK